MVRRIDLSEFNESYESNSSNNASNANTASNATYTGSSNNTGNAGNANNSSDTNDQATLLQLQRVSTSVPIDDEVDSASNGANTAQRWATFFLVLLFLCALMFGVYKLLPRQISSQIQGFFTGNHISTVQEDENTTTLTIGVRETLPSLDIRSDNASSVEQALIGNVYETLLTHDNNGHITAGLAQDWSVSDDGLTLEFTIKEHLTFSDGSALNASSAVASLQTILSQSFLGSDKLSNIVSVANSDDLHFTIKLSAPSPTLLHDLTGRAGIVYNTKISVDYATQAAGSGPYIVESIGKQTDATSTAQEGSKDNSQDDSQDNSQDGAHGDSNANDQAQEPADEQYSEQNSDQDSDHDNATAHTQLTLITNTNYWGEQPNAGRVTFTYVDNDAELLDGLRNTTYDIALPTDLSSWSQAGELEQVRTITASSYEKVLLAFNNTGESLFSDQQIRKATRYLLDTQAIVAAQPDAAAALAGPITQLEPGYEDLTGLFPHDAATANKMFSYFYASYFKPINLIAPANYSNLATLVTSQLTASGYLKVNLEVLDEATYQQRLAEGSFSAAIMTMDGYLDAGAFATLQLPFNYENGEAQKYYAGVLNASNDADFQAHLRAFASTVSQDAASAWLYNRQDLIAASTSIDEPSIPRCDITHRFLVSSINKAN